MNKKTSRWLATGALVSSLALAAGSIVPIFALNGTPNTQVEVPISKTWDKGQGVPVPSKAVEFNIAPVTVAAGTPVLNNGIPVQSSIRSEIANATITITPPANSSANMNQQKVSSSGTITPANFNVGNFPSAGLYRFQVTEDTTKLEDGVAQAPLSTAYPGTYYLDVYVQNQVGADGKPTGQKEIKDFILWGQVATSTAANPAGQKKPSMDFLNNYTTNPLTITKIITGNSADSTRTFAFEVTVTPDNTSDTFYVTKTIKGAPQTVETINSANSFKFTVDLGQNDSFTIQGLSAKDKYTVQETDTTMDAQGYSVVPINVKGPDTWDENTKTLTGDTSGGADSYTWNNYRHDTIPTNYISTYGPYIAGLAVLGGLGFVMLRKKKVSE